MKIVSRFLGLFGEHAELHREVLTLAGAKIAAEDRLRHLEAEVSDLRRQLIDAQKETVHSVQCVADWVSQQQYGTKIYGPAPALPANAPEPELFNQRIQARKLCAQLEEEFERKFEYSQ